MKLFSAVLAAALVGSLYTPDASADRRGDRGDRGGHRGDRGGRRGDRGGHGHDYHRDPPRRGYYPRPGYGYYPGYPGYSDGYAEVDCSPEVKQKNVAIVETTLNGLVVTPAFKDATLLRDTVASIQSKKDVGARIAAYTALVGVDANNPSELAEFVGARDLATYVDFAREELKLSQDQADTLVNTLSENLLNGINN